MKSYIVTFQANTEATRNKIRDTLKTFGSYCPIHKYCWAVITDKTAKDIRDMLSPLLAKDERVFVIRSGTEIRLEALIWHQAQRMAKGESLI